MATPTTLTFSLPSGPLGVAIQQLPVQSRQAVATMTTEEARINDPGSGSEIIIAAEGAFCVVKSKTDPNSLFEANDVILSLNGITLSTVTGGVGAWVTLFRAFSERKVVVLRRPMTTNIHVAQHFPHVVQQQQQQQQQLLHHMTSMAEIATKRPLGSLPLSIGNAPVHVSAAAVGKASAAATRSGDDEKKKHVPVGNVGYTFRKEFDAGWFTGTVIKIMTDGDRRCKYTDGDIEDLYLSDLIHLAKLDPDNNNNSSSTMEEGFDDTDVITTIPTLPPMAAVTTTKSMLDVICDAALTIDTITKAKKQQAKEAGKRKTPSTSLKQGNKKSKGVPSAGSSSVGAAKRHDDFEHDDNYMKLLTDGYPDAGRVSSCLTYYVASNNENLPKIAEKLGLSSWKLLNDIEFNKRFYGQITGNMTLKRDTVIKIPTSQCSKWKLSKLVDNQIEEIKAMATCSKCLVKEQPDDTDEMLMCDGCDLAIHVSCAGLFIVPDGDWLCKACLDILDARKKSVLTSGDGRRSLKAKMPPLKKLDDESAHMVTTAKMRYREDMMARKMAALCQLEENQSVMAVASKSRVNEMENEIRNSTARVAEAEKIHNSARSATMYKHGLNGWSINTYGSSYIITHFPDGKTKTLQKEVKYGRVLSQCPEWEEYYKKVQACSREMNSLPQKRAYETAKSRLDSLNLELIEARNEYNDRWFHENTDRKNLLLKFAKLLSEPRLTFETSPQYLSRAGRNPLFLGIVKIEEPGVRVLNILKEPTELLIPIPVDSVIAIDENDDNNIIRTGAEYYLFGTAELFCPERNDCTPMDFSPTSTRTAQRDLMSMLRRDSRNSAFVVSQPVIPSSVVLRGTTNETLSDIVKCFDLSELVRDCHYPIQDQPLAETPKRLSENGLVLRDYQKASLQWLIDKECNPTGIGSSGELWSRMRGLDIDDGYFYCELTGSLLKEIFNYNSDVGQGDASTLGGDTFPSSAILGSEMGLGKTVMALSLVVASPPRLENRALPREYVANIRHPAYLPPPSVAEIVSFRKSHTFLSNATLVVAPMTLCPQWASEIARFAPWMSFVTLHNDETESAAEIATKDIVIVSTFIMSQPTGKQKSILDKLRAIHFHRIFLDESHYNNTGKRVKLSLSQLSSTHRYCVTGTPVGHSLADLYGQLRFLRVPEFCRPDFWEQNVSSPYSDRNCYALNVLRSLLSHIVIRHSKEQTLNNGDALVSLPPRNVETLLINFGSEAERNIYEYIELRNTQRFTELRADSPASVLSKFMDLQGMMSSARMACVHASLVNLDSLHNLNERIELERRRKKESLLREQLGKELWEVEKKKKTASTTRAEVFHEAINNARPSAQARMRDVVLLFHEGELEHAECPVCLEATGEKDIALTPCAHLFCAECILSCLHTLSSTREPTGKCPECREAIKKSELTFLGHAQDAGKSPAEDQKPEAKQESTESTFDINGFSLSTKDTVAAGSTCAGDRRISYQPLTDLEKREQRAFCHTLPPEFLTSWNDGFNTIGTKVARLLEEIKSMRKDPTAKAVVFSQYLGVLDVAGQEMMARGINFVRVDGTMQQYQRADAIQSFTNDPHTVVLLLSMRAGAAGLNLMVANHCFLMDPAMNSAVEEQAIDRIHRIGQTRPVFVKRLIIKDSIEERILESRRSLSADRPSTSTHLDGTGLLDVNDTEKKGSKKRDRINDEGDMGEQRFHRLHQLELLFGCSAKVKTDV